MNIQQLIKVLGAKINNPNDYSRKNIFISGAVGAGKTTFINHLLESVDISIRIIDPDFPTDNWKSKGKKLTPKYFDLSLSSGSNSVFGGLLNMLESAQGLIEFRPLYNVRKSSDELSEPILWIVNSADLLVKYFPKKRPIKELALQKFDLFDPIPSDNAIEPIIKTLKEGALRHNTMIISGQSFSPENYGLLACDLSNFNFSLWIGKNNIELVVRKFFKNKISLLKELDSFNQKCFPVLAVTSTGEFILENYE